METVRQILTSQAAFIAALAILTTQYGAGQAPAFTTLYSFQGGADGKQPTSGVILGTNGALYGTTFVGGTANDGSVFSLAPGTGGSWTHTVLLSFSGSDGKKPFANLVFGSNGALYGTTPLGGGSGGGTIYALTPPGTEGGAWTESVLYNFSGGCGQRTPQSALLIGSGGTLYGTTYANACIQGSIPAGGTAFLLGPPVAPGRSWTEHVLLNLDTTPLGNSPFAGLVYSGGSLYGTTGFVSSAEGCGDVFQLSPPTTAEGAWTSTAIHIFLGAASDGCQSTAVLTVGPGGVLYGTTLIGGSGATCYLNGISGGGCGTVFELTPPATAGGTWTETVLYNFTGVNGDGAYPYGGVTLGKNGVLYGTTEYGGTGTASSPCLYDGAVGCGTVFKLTPPAAPGGTWTETILHSFTQADGAVPMAGLTASPSGVLYGTTSSGGASQAGTVFSITP